MVPPTVIEEVVVNPPPLPFRGFCIFVYSFDDVPSDSPVQPQTSPWKNVLFYISVVFGYTAPAPTEVTAL